MNGEPVLVESAGIRQAHRAPLSGALDFDQPTLSHDSWLGNQDYIRAGARLPDAGVDQKFHFSLAT